MIKKIIPIILILIVNIVNIFIIINIDTSCNSYQIYTQECRNREGFKLLLFGVLILFNYVIYTYFRNKKDE